MVSCESTSFVYPLLADIYYPIVEQSAYGNVKKDWMLDRTIACSFATINTKTHENIKTNPNISEEFLLVGRCRTDIRFSTRSDKNSMTNIIITNILDRYSNEVYVESSGPRAGKSTLFEISTIEPFIGPFGTVEYYGIVLKRSENQASTL